MAQYDIKAFENTVDVWDICGTFGELNNLVHHDNGMVKCATHEISVSTEIKKSKHGVFSRITTVKNTSDKPISFNKEF